MAERSAEHDALVDEAAAIVIGRMDDRLPAITSYVQDLLAKEVAEVAADGELLVLIRDVVQGNFDAFFAAIRHGIAIDHVEAPTAAIEHARRAAQRNVDADALVRGYRVGHQAVVGLVLDEVRAAQLEQNLALDVFQKITSESFRYVDRMSGHVLDAYQTERDRWLKNQDRVRALRVQEVIDADEADIDEMAEAIGYPLRRTHLAAAMWCCESADGNELLHMERFANELGTSLGARDRCLFIASDRVTAWTWIPLEVRDASDVAVQVRAFAETHNDVPEIAVAVGNPDRKS